MNESLEVKIARVEEKIGNSNDKIEELGSKIDAFLKGMAEQQKQINNIENNLRVTKAFLAGISFGFSLIGSAIGLIINKFI